MIKLHNRKKPGRIDMHIVTVDEMRNLEAQAAEKYGLTSPILMENAGKSAAEILAEYIRRQLPTNVFSQNFRGAFPRVFHQYWRCQAIFLCSLRFQIPHFVNGNDVHIYSPRFFSVV